MTSFRPPLLISLTRIVTLLFAAVASLPIVHAATLIVTSTADSGAGSLRDTIAAATTGDIIQFDTTLYGQTITLTSGSLDVGNFVTIDGPGADQLTVRRSDGGGIPAFSVFELYANSTISGLTIANGTTGGIITGGSGVTIANCTITGNSYSSSGGGGILCGGSNYDTPTVTITNCTISGNSASSGGGIYIVGNGFYGYHGPSVTIANSTISGNSAAQGGGILNVGTLTLINSTVSGNTATVDQSGGGGGISNGAALTVTNSTISGNSAAQGGGIQFVSSFALNPSRLAITNSTISGNSANEGGGIYAEINGGQTSRNTIIALNTSPNGPDLKGRLTSNGFNIIGNNSYAAIASPQSSDQIGTPASPIDPLLGPLQDNGGPTFTHALLPGSPAIDQGHSSGSTTDQRSFARPMDLPDITNTAGGDGSDIGALESVAATLANISTRVRVGTGDSALIGGFIITGTQPKTVIVRGIGPSLTVPGALADPVIEVYDSSGVLRATNDNWTDALSRQQIALSGLAPSNDLESALWGIINPGAYTVVVRGNNDATGIGLFEVYDLDQTVNSRLGNISTRGFVGTGDDVMVGGTIIIGNHPARVLVRAIGPSLTNFGVANALGDPTLELHDGNGALMASNDNWRSDQEAEIIATGIPPSNDLESAILRDLAPGNYTAIVRGVSNMTGVSVVEAYELN